MDHVRIREAVKHLYAAAERLAALADELTDEEGMSLVKDVLLQSSENIFTIAQALESIGGGLH
jgi:hypothetical protein